MKKLLPLIAGAFLLNCQSKPIRNQEVLPPPIIRQEPKRSEFHEVLRDYIYCLYDQSLGMPTPDFNTSKNSLEECLRAAKFSRDDSRLLFEGKHVPDLEQFFASQGLVFRPFNTPGFERSYELVRFGPVESKELEVFGVQKCYEKVDVIDILIDNAADHESKLNLSNSSRVGGAHGFLSGAIEIRPQTYESMAKSYFAGINSLRPELEKDLADTSRLESYSDEKLYDRLGKLFHYLAVRKEFSESSSFEEFKAKVMPRWTRESEFHEVMHLMDLEGNKRVPSSLDDSGKNEFFESMAVNLEARAYLAQIHHGTGRDNLGHMFSTLVGDEPGKMNEHQKAAKLILYVMSMEIKGNVESDRSVYIRMLSLSDKEINNLAKKAFDVLYEGKSFGDYMNAVEKQLLREQRFR